jgi:hypothetical protein
MPALDQYNAVTEARMFKRLLADMAAKAFGAASTKEYQEHNVKIFLDRHGIKNAELVEYRVDRSPHQSQFYRVAMVGKAHRNGGLVGVLIIYDEAVGTILGSIIPAENTIRHGIIAKQYRAGQMHYSTLYSAFLHEMDGYDTDKMQPKCALD